MALINRKLMQAIELTKMISTFQRGFLKASRCSDLAILLAHILTDSHKKKKNLFVTMIDFTDAYDSIRQDKLFELFTYLKIPQTVIKLFEHIYSGHMVSIKTAYGLTRLVPFLKGLPQGDPASPCVFNIYTEILNRALQEFQSGYRYNNSHCIPLLAYADDLTILSPSKKSR
jgi:hypothetical protein